MRKGLGGEGLGTRLARPSRGRRRPGENALESLVPQECIGHAARAEEFLPREIGRLRQTSKFVCVTGQSS